MNIIELLQTSYVKWICSYVIHRKVVINKLSQCQMFCINLSISSLHLSNANFIQNFCLSPHRVCVMLGGGSSTHFILFRGVILRITFLSTPLPYWLSSPSHILPQCWFPFSILSLFFMLLVFSELADCTAYLSRSHSHAAHSFFTHAHSSTQVNQYEYLCSVILLLVSSETVLLHHYLLSSGLHSFIGHLSQCIW